MRSVPYVFEELRTALALLGDGLVEFCRLTSLVQELLASARCTAINVSRARDLVPRTLNAAIIARTQVVGGSGVDHGQRA